MTILPTMRSSFPILEQAMGGHRLVYFDSAATTHPPQEVLEAVRGYYDTIHSNVHRSVHDLASRATDAVEGVRMELAAWLGADNAEEIIFTAGTTASLNLLATAYGGEVLEAGDEVLVSVMEHHSNFLPWRRCCTKRGALLRVIPLTAKGELDRVAFSGMLGPRTKLVALTYLSHVLGTVNPLREMIAEAHRHGAMVVVDAAQAVAHLRLNVVDLNCDFLAFSSHKMYGPTGLGVLYGKGALLRKMVPYQLGGGMVRSMDVEGPCYEGLPYVLEAGTLNLGGIIGLGAARSFLEGVGYEALRCHGERLVRHARKVLSTVPGLRVVGIPKEQRGLLSFVIEGRQSLDIGLLLGVKGFAVRAGSHCALPLMAALELGGTVRISFGVYNNCAEVDRLGEALRELVAGS